MLSLFSTSGTFAIQCDTVPLENYEYTLSSSGTFYPLCADVVITSDTCTFDVVWKNFTKALFTTASFRSWGTEELKACTDVQSFQLMYNQLPKPHDISTERWQALADKFNIPLEF